ncbi:MAG: class I SAM-dependent methyltransferase [Candidatus Babeliales bacterium]|jgi:predicted O-methyltransferase YrrM
MKKSVLVLFAVVFLSPYSLLGTQFRKVPWLTEEAINFLELFLQNKRDAKILEFGSGASTIWFAQRTKNLVSIEHNAHWFKTVLDKLKADKTVINVKLSLKKRPYHTACDAFPDETFDLILVDGRNRKLCIINSLRILKRGGILMLDNAERSYYQCVINEYLKNWKVYKTIQKTPDACGFCYPNWQTNWWIKP